MPSGCVIAERACAHVDAGAGAGAAVAGAGVVAGAWLRGGGNRRPLTHSPPSGAHCTLAHCALHRRWMQKIAALQSDMKHGRRCDSQFFLSGLLLKRSQSEAIAAREPSAVITAAVSSYRDECKRASVRVACR